MIDLPMKAEVHCSDGIAGISTQVIVNPNHQQITHLVVQSDLPPFHEYLVPFEQVEETAPNRIKLKCSQEDLLKIELFKVEEFIPTEMPGHLSWPYCVPIPGSIAEVADYIPVEHHYFPLGEQMVQIGARVEATDGAIGQVEELLINSNNMQVTHLVLLEQNILTKRKIIIPVSQIDHVDENTVYLNMARQNIGELTTTPIQR